MSLAPRVTSHAMQPSAAAALECGCLVLSSCLIVLDWGMQCVFGAASGAVLPGGSSLGHDQPRLGSCPGLSWWLGLAQSNTSTGTKVFSMVDVDIGIGGILHGVPWHLSPD